MTMIYKVKVTVLYSGMQYTIVCIIKIERMELEINLRDKPE